MAASLALRLTNWLHWGRLVVAAAAVFAVSLMHEQYISVCVCGNLDFVIGSERRIIYKHFLKVRKLWLIQKINELNFMQS